MRNVLHIHKIPSRVSSNINGSLKYLVSGSTLILGMFSESNRARGVERNNCVCSSKPIMTAGLRKSSVLRMDFNFSTENVYPRKGAPMRVSRRSSDSTDMDV